VLILKRRIGERLMIGDNIIITVVSIDRSGVRLGVEAPADVRIDREEVWEKRKESVQQESN